jgi:hypothetical protein
MWRDTAARYRASRLEVRVYVHYWYIHIYTYIHTHIHRHTHTHIHTHTNIHIHKYIHTHIHIHTQNVYIHSLLIIAPPSPTHPPSKSLYPLTIPLSTHHLFIYTSIYLPIHLSPLHPPYPTSARHRQGGAAQAQRQIQAAGRAERTYVSVCILYKTHP